MANVKDVDIRGFIPFDCDDRNPEMMNVLGILNMPVEGLRINYTGFVPRKDDEETTMVYFIICGQEAVSDAFLVRIINAVKGCKGEVTKATVKDLENNGNPYNLMG